MTVILGALRAQGKTAEAIASLKQTGGSLIVRDEATAKRIADAHGGLVSCGTDRSGGRLGKKPKEVWMVSF